MTTIIDNATRKVDLPKGYTLESEERMNYLRKPPEVDEVKWVLKDPDGETITTTTCFNHRRYGEWVVGTGMNTSYLLPDEARGRAVALVLAAEEVDRRNGS